MSVESFLSQADTQMWTLQESSNSLNPFSFLLCSPPLSSPLLLYSHLTSPHLIPPLLPPSPRLDSLDHTSPFTTTTTPPFLSPLHQPQSSLRDNPLTS